MNKVAMTGIIDSIEKEEDKAVLVRIKCKDNNKRFYAFWFNNVYNTSELLNQFVSVEGSLEYISVKVSKVKKRILAIEVDELVRYEGDNLK